MIVRAILRGLAAAGVTVVLAACGSSGDAGGDATTASPAQTTPSSASTPSTADEVTVAAVTKAYQTFFASDSTAEQVEAAIQNGTRFHDTIAAEGSSKYSGTSGVKVTAVTLQSPDVAHVTFSVTSNGAVVLPGASGYAVRSGDGTWQVAAATFCQLLTLEGTAPAACKQAAATALPSP